LELDQKAQATKADEEKLISLLSSRIEVAMGPTLMTGGLLVAVAAYLSGMPQPLPTAISMVGLTVAMVGGASEISFLLAASRAADIVSGTKGTTGLLRVLGVAALIGLYMVVVGMPLVGLYVLRIAARAGVKRGQLLSGLLPLYSLLTLGPHHFRLPAGPRYCPRGAPRRWRLRARRPSASRQRGPAGAAGS